MDFKPIILQGFNGREEALRKIPRYVHYITPRMAYRTNDLTHSRRVLWHLEEALPNILAVYGADFNTEFARTLALVHDDVEIVTGDVQLHDKERMTPKESEKLAKLEREAIQKIVDLYGSVANGHDYRQLLIAAKEKNCIEAQFVSFFDKFDGAGEAWHEVWAGNELFLLPAGGNDNQSGGYVRRLNEFPTKYPVMTDFFKLFPEYLPHPFDFKETAKIGRLHTPESLERDSEYPPYERWKRTIINREGKKLLTTIVELI